LERLAAVCTFYGGFVLRCWTREGSVGVPQRAYLVRQPGHVISAAYTPQVRKMEEGKATLLARRGLFTRIQQRLCLLLRCVEVRLRCVLSALSAEGSTSCVFELVIYLPIYSLASFNGEVALYPLLLSVL
jgi:hypothetical protein